jgi:hypothetical protein
MSYRESFIFWEAPSEPVRATLFKKSVPGYECGSESGRGDLFWSERLFFGA